MLILGELCYMTRQVPQLEMGQSVVAEVLQQAASCHPIPITTGCSSR